MKVLWIILMIAVMFGALFVLLKLLRRRNQEKQEPVTATINAATESVLDITLDASSAAFGQSGDSCSFQAVDDVHKGVIASVYCSLDNTENGAELCRRTAAGFEQAIQQIHPNERYDLRLLHLASLAQKEAQAAVKQLKCHGCSFASVQIASGHLFYLSAGNCTVNLFRSGGVLVLNRLHTANFSIDEEWAVTGKGKKQDSEGEKKLTSWLGAEEWKPLDRNEEPIPLLKGDKILLCTGKLSALKEEEIMDLLDQFPDGAAGAITNALIEKGNPRSQSLVILIRVD